MATYSYQMANLCEWSKTIDRAKEFTDSDEERLLCSHAPLMLSIYKKRRRFLSDDDLQDGMIDLLHALRAFDPSRGLKFSTIAYSYINNGISTRWTRRNSQRLTNHATIPVGEIVLRSPDNVSQRHAKQHVYFRARVALMAMDEIIRKRVWMYFFEDMPMREIGRIEGVSFQAIQQSITAALRQAREVLECFDRGSN